MQQDWIYALIGGGLIGVAATVLLLVNGRVMGVSGIFFGALEPKKSDTLWRWKFLAGLLLGGLLATLLIEDPFRNVTGIPLGALALAGFLVGFGTRLGSGCTSGHGVCGISRLSPRSMVATITFILAGVMTVALVSFVLGGAS